MPLTPDTATPLSNEPVTLLEVARVAGVSPSTVSRILNGTAKVAPAKREAVEAGHVDVAHDELGPGAPRGRPQPLPALEAVRGRHHLMARLFEEEGEHVQQGGIIVDEEDAGHDLGASVLGRRARDGRGLSRSLGREGRPLRRPR